ncbi:MAG: hypothetical protein DRJ10_17415, partial [Bacteroidetes bacterium]
QVTISDTLHINDVNIVSNRLQNFVTGNRLEEVDSLNKELFQNKDLAELLSNSSTIAIKSYGVSGLGSASIRGTNTNHIAVLWNGFNIQDPLTAGLGLNLIPSSFIDDISIQYGGSSSLFGSGAIGGVIHLNNKADFHKGTKLNFMTSYGSFHSYYAGLDISLSNKNFNTKLKTFYSSNENDFSFINTAKFGKPEELNENSKVESEGLLYENFIRFADYSLLSTHYWYQNIFREIPNNMAANPGTAWQKDISHKAAIKYYKNINKVDLYVKSGLFYSNLHYFNDDINIDAVHSSILWITDFESKIELFTNHLLNIGFTNEYTQGNSENFSSNEELNKLAFFLSYKLTTKNKKLVLVGTLREEYHNEQFIQPNFSLGGNLIIVGKLEGKFNISKNYRLPTFNDLFWADGFAKGNPNLKPENAYSSELGIIYSPLQKKQVLGIELTIFGNYIKDLILWQPTDNIWSPINLKENFARGVELNLHGQYLKNKYLFNYKLAYSYTKSSIEKIAENESENILHNQLPDVPFHQLNITLSARYKNISISLIQGYTGEVYTDLTNSRVLEDYFLGNLAINYKLPVKKMRINTFLKINNIWNSTYQTVYLYPNPLRNYELGFKMNFNIQKL